MRLIIIVIITITITWNTTCIVACTIIACTINACINACIAVVARDHVCGRRWFGGRYAISHHLHPRLLHELVRPRTECTTCRVHTREHALRTMRTRTRTRIRATHTSHTHPL